MRFLKQLRISEASFLVCLQETSDIELLSKIQKLMMETKSYWKGGIPNWKCLPCEIECIEAKKELLTALLCEYQIRTFNTNEGKMHLAMASKKKIKASEDDAQIGSGKHALTTDPSGKFWGNAGAGGIFFAKDSERFLLAFRSKYVNEPGTWGVWGGAIDGTETPDKAIVREIREETKYKGTYKLVPSFVFKKGNFTYSNYVIVVDTEFKPELDWETEKSGWFKLDEFPDPLHFGLKALLPHLKEKY